MEKLTKSKERVAKYGEVFTPSHIVEAMLDALGADRLGNAEKIFFEPTCGNGQFLVGIIERRLSHGIDIIVALNTLVGIELQEDNVIESHKRLAKLCWKHLRKMDASIGEKVHKYIKCCAIIRNNIFQGDSLAYMKERMLSSHLFFYNPIVDSNANFMDDDERFDLMLNTVEFLENKYFD